MAKIDISGVNLDALAKWQEIDANNRPDWSPPVILPPSWIVVEKTADGAKYYCKPRTLRAMISCSFELDGRAWLHLSVSHRIRVPSWQELVLCKEIFLGNREAYQVLPPPERYVNIHPHVLHLFALLDNDVVLPDFTHGTGSL